MPEVFETWKQECKTLRAELFTAKRDGKGWEDEALHFKARCDAQAAQIERLREALEKVENYHSTYPRNDEVEDLQSIARAALREDDK